MLPSVELSAGPVEYSDTGGDGPVVVLLHGVLMDGRQWRDVVRELDGFRCLLPTLPLGAHRRAMRADADLSLRGQARLVGEFLDALSVEDATLVFNDWACAQLLVADGRTGRVGRMLLASCETAGNYPPGLPGRNLALLGRTAAGTWVALNALRFRPLRRTPLTFGWLSKRGVPDELLDSWLSAARDDRAVRRDLRAYVSRTAQGRRDLVSAQSRLSSFRKPVLVVWAEEDRVMPLDEGRRLAESFPDGRFVTVLDSYTLIPLDQPAVLARLLSEFVLGTGRPPAGPGRRRDGR